LATWVTKLALESFSNREIGAFSNVIRVSAFVVLGLGAVIIPFSDIPEAHALSCYTTITTDTVLTSDLSNCSGGNGAVIVGADSITLNCQGHKITGNPPNPFLYGTGVNLVSRKDVTVKNCVFQNLFYGILFSQGSQNQIVNDTAIDNQFGFRADSSSSHNTLAFDTASGSQTGFWLQASLGDNLYSNIAHDNIQGFEVEGSNSSLKFNLAYNNTQGPNFNPSGAGFYIGGYGNTVMNNTAYGQWSGFQLFNSNYAMLISDTSYSNKYGFFSSHSAHNTLSSSSFDRNVAGGLYLGDVSNNNSITGNEIKSNGGDGIRAYLADFNTISSNFIIANPIGIHFVTMGISNLIYNNYFRNTVNAVDTQTSTNHWNTTKILGTNIVGGPFLGGNFWSDYFGVDLDRDGLGDTLLPANSSGNILSGGDFLPLAIISPTVGGTIVPLSRPNTLGPSLALSIVSLLIGGTVVYLRGRRRGRK